MVRAGVERLNRPKRVKQSDGARYESVTDGGASDTRAHAYTIREARFDRTDGWRIYWLGSLSNSRLQLSRIAEWGRGGVTQCRSGQAVNADWLPPCAPKCDHHDKLS
jgi:hypothetical protein